MKMMNDPFDTGRPVHRLLFDFSIGISFLNHKSTNKRILDWACGTGWTSEFLNKMGYITYGFDIDADVIKIANDRYRYDNRIDKNRINFAVMDGHRLDYKNNYFGHIYCFDSLHHMSNYLQTFREMYRILDKGGRAIFVEPGSRHSRSPETIAFLKNNPHDDYWIEKDVVLSEIFRMVEKIGFKELVVKPYLDPSLVSFSFTDWFHILQNEEGRENYFRELRRFNYEDRVIFCITK